MGAIPEILERQLAEGALPHACLFSGGDDTAKDGALDFLLTRLLGADYRRSPDYFEVDGRQGSIAIKETRAAKERLYRTPLAGSLNVLVLKALENLTRDAAPSLLKLLEEPAERSLILATTSGTRKILPTIRSRFSVIRLGNFADTAPPAAAELRKLAQKPADKYPLEEILNQGLLYASVLLREVPSGENIKRLESMLNIKTVLLDPTVSRRLLREYFMMVL